MPHYNLMRGEFDQYRIQGKGESSRASPGKGRGNFQ
jgi:hypothetical protein